MFTQVCRRSTGRIQSHYGHKLFCLCCYITLSVDLLTNVSSLIRFLRVYSSVLSDICCSKCFKVNSFKFDCVGNGQTELITIPYLTYKIEIVDTNNDRLTEKLLMNQFNPPFPKYNTFAADDIEQTYANLWKISETETFE